MNKNELTALIKSAAYCGQPFGDTDNDILRKEAGIRKAYEKLVRFNIA